MNKSIFLTLALGFPILCISPTRAEDLNQLQQLLSTNQCNLCDLSRAGLVQSNLSGARLSGANLRGANLSQANLSGADLDGADLTGAILFGANLTGANLRGAILNGTDLRNAYLVNAEFGGATLEKTFLRGAVGIPLEAATPELFYTLGIDDTRQGQNAEAIENFNRALTINPDFAPAYLARAIANFHLGNNTLAADDARTASTLFERQNNPEGQKAAEDFIQGMELALKPKKEPGQTSSLDRVVQGIGSVLLQFVIPFLGFL
ncbi:pentapeptide repeat-containing protein [Pannus brasiliensis CCIBt3594]|uniref:Pentapeptide repeat-containing protein n=1 Tax=Pannus brasiliensis CCIBt3594 TaxID=1427578 RepID=A0AAW9QF49_9CHRO